MFKPADKGLSWLCGILKSQICEGLNALEQRPVKTDVKIIGTLKKKNLEVILHPSYSDSILAVGPRYQPQDIRLEVVYSTLWAASGVTLVAVFPSKRDVAMLRSCNLIRTYHVDCLLGLSTETGRVDGKVIDRSKYQHVTAALIERVLNSIQGAYQKNAFLYAGVEPDSEDAYKLMCNGLVRPDKSGSPPLIYSIRCIDLQPPKFTLELQLINESDEFLCHLVRDIGGKLRATAAAERFRLMRFGPFTANMALLQRSWRLNEILQNIQETNRRLDELRYSDLLGQRTPGQSILRVVHE